MALTSGTKLGPYEILEPIGAGGMGEVYRARDTRLERTVAIKVLPSHLSSDPERKQRFEREAKAISSLNHPHICTLHDVGYQDGVDFLVMEHLEGETLAERLKKGSLGTEQVLKIGMEVADALDKAHRQGVVHRDLKPGNIMLTKSGAKLLDFGLAKPTGMAVASGTMAEAMTAASPASPASPTTPLTQQGTIVGTFQYMSPEQVEGKEADARTDIFALGAVLYEMATGKRAFEGKSQLSVASAILEREPEPISRIKPLAPVTLEHVVKACLAKDPEERWQSAADVRRQLKWIAEGGTQVSVTAPAGAPSRRWSRWGWPAVSLALLLAAAILGGLWLRGRSAPQPAMFFQAPLPFTAEDMTLSPDGHTLAAAGYLESVNKNVIWIHDVGSRRAENIPGTEGATFPFWSADGHYVAFFADGKLKKVEVPGGRVQTICDAPSGRGGAWNKDGVILFAPSALTELFRVPASGGTPVPLTKLDAGRLETSHRWPVFLPDGNHFLYLAANFSGHPETNAIFVGSLDSEPRRMIVEASANAAYAVPGYLLFYHDKALMAQPFDVQRFTLTGEPTTIVSDVQFLPQVDRAAFAVSDSGLLVSQGVSYATGSQLAWFDRSGKPLGTAGQPAVYGNVALAPDGSRIALDSTDSDSTNIDLWTMEVARLTAKRFTFDPAMDAVPAWSPDGRQLLFGSNRNLTFDLFVKNSDGSGEDKVILHGGNIAVPNDWSRDGRYILYTQGTTLRYLTVPEYVSKPFLQTKAVLANGQYSPDGRWVAYSSNETGRWEIYVVSFPEPSGKWQVSSGGGQQPKWRGDGRELFYLSPQGKMMAVPVNLGNTVDAGMPMALFQAHPRQPVSAVDVFTYDVSRDGRRFLIITQVEHSGASPMSVILNWPAQLRK